MQRARCLVDLDGFIEERNRLIEDFYSVLFLSNLYS